MREKVKSSLAAATAAGLCVLASLSALSGCSPAASAVISSTVSLAIASQESSADSVTDSSQESSAESSESSSATSSQASSAASSKTSSATSSKASSEVSSKTDSKASSADSSQESSAAASSKTSSATSSKTSSATSSKTSSATSSKTSSATSSKTSSATSSKASTTAASAASSQASSGSSSKSYSEMTQSEQWASKLLVLADPVLFNEMLHNTGHDFWDDDEFWESGKVLWSLPPDDPNVTYIDGNGSEFVAASDAVTALKNNKVTTRSDGVYTTKSYYDTIILIVAYEFNNSYHDECIKAQMVASYTYLRYHAGSTSLPPTAGLASAEVQNSRWGTEGMARLRSLLNEVAGAMLTINGYPIFSTYGSINNGVTNYVEDVWATGPVDAYGNTYSYLAGGIDSHWDKKASGYRREVAVSSSSVKKAIESYYKGIVLSAEPEYWIQVLGNNRYGYALNVNIDDQAITTSRILRHQILNAANLGSANKLRSTSFTIEYDKETDCFYIEMTGYGHGVGMSQEGAQLMAKEGYTWQKIVLHYFPGATITQG